MTILRQEWEYFKQDLNSNRGNTKSMFVVLFYRACRISIASPMPIRILALPLRAFYKIVVIYILGIDFPAEVSSGGGLKIYHGVGLVVHPNVVIGQNCTLRHGVTLGNKTESGGVPIVENNVEFGCGVVALGPVHIGSDVVIGAGSLVLKNIPAQSVFFNKRTNNS